MHNPSYLWGDYWYVWAAAVMLAVVAIAIRLVMTQEPDPMAGLTEAERQELDTLWEFFEYRRLTPEEQGRIHELEAKGVGHG